MKTKRSLALLLVFPVSLVAQTNKPAESEPVVELSPFVVSTAPQSGYYASQTLAGTRLKTDLKDVAASIQILTPEFLDDVGATSLSDLFLYTTNTEASGLNGNFSAATSGETSVGDEAGRVDPQGTQRVRGLAAADITRNYFLTIIPTDRFNTDRVEINRGANAILFGLGSPAGIANTALTAAEFRNFGRTALLTDSEGSRRAEFDFNTPLIKDRLALRVGALRNDTNYYQRPADEYDRRIYGALAVRPWKGAVVRASTEHGSRDANRPSTIPPASTIGSWFDYNPVVRNLMRAELAAARVNLAVPDNMILAYDAAAQDLSSVNYLTVADLNKDGVVDSRDAQARLAVLMNQIIYHKNVNERYVAHPNMSRQIARVFQYNQPNPGGVVGGANAFMTSVNSQNFRPTLSVVPPSLDPGGDRRFSYLYQVSQQPWRQDRLLVPESLQDLNVFDFTRNLISGEAGFQNDRWKQYNATFEQTGLHDRVGIEFAFDRQLYSRRSFVPYQGYTGIFLDLMKNYLGQDNPNFGRPFVEARTPMNELKDERTTFRVTSFVRWRPADVFKESRLARWLGEHTITALYSDYDQTADSTTWHQYYTDVNGGSVFSATDPLGDQRRIMNYIVYLGDQDVTQLSSPGQVRLNRMQNQQIWNPGQTSTIQSVDPVTGRLYPLTLNTSAFASNYRQDVQRVKSYAANGNAHLFERSLVGLVGWRRDEAYTAGYLAQTNDDELADRTNLRLNNGGETKRADTFSWSGVAHVPERFLPRHTRLSAHYGVSENFALGATPNDFFGNRVDSSSGKTRESGITLSLFEDKFIGRVNWFETTLKNRQLSGNDNIYAKFVNQGFLGIYASLIEAEYHGFHSPATDPSTGLLDPGTPNHDPVVKALAEFRKLVPGSLLAETNLASVNQNGIANKTLANIGDTDDVKAKGLEVELVYNPTKAWRISASVAKQETVVTNFSPRMGALLAATEPLIGKNGSISSLAFFNNANGNPPAFISGPTPTVNSVYDWLEANVYSVYRNKKLQEGRVSDEQRKWRVNVVTNYNFTRSFLRGFGVGAAYRWQDGAAIGYPTQLIGGELVADVAHPHMAPSETNIDAWLRYKRKVLGNKVEWQIELRVMNLNTNADELIPVKAALNTAYDVAVWRVGPPRIWRLTNSFRF